MHKIWIITKLILVLFVLGSAGTAFGLDIDVETKVGASTETPSAGWLQFNGRFATEAVSDAGSLEVFADMQLDNRGLYGGFMGGTHGFGDMAFSFGESGFRYTTEALRLEAGRTALRDIVVSPYSLFASSRNNLALGAAVSYDDGLFFYETRWTALNYDLRASLVADEIPDRSAFSKAWGIRFGSFRFAFQDAAVATTPLEELDTMRGPLFDAEYFLLPIPSIFIQYLGISQDTPWKKYNLNDNSLMGFMLDWSEGPWYAVGQVLVDDINMNRFIDPDGKFNPDKIAWQLGGRLETDYGTFGLYHAGATKYTFQPYGHPGLNTQYGYTYYPFTTYTVNGLPMALEPEANYVGYLHGENNLAFMGTYKGAFMDVGLAASLEFTLSGSKSPANPWHEGDSYLDFGEGTKFLDDPVLEKKLVLKAGASYPWGNWLFGLDASLGGVWNRLMLGAPPSGDAWNDIPIYSPSDEHAVIAELTIGARYRFLPRRLGN